ncbi:MAG: CDP-diacylglycerol--serine O-phosphatidyltransferase [Bacteroidales bacterium]|nr:CDP-diacylglycerol--serine O-phosphatidyltransferase [Bacteroidales bacterium]
MRKQIPNIITLLNLFCGIESIFQLLYFDNPFLASVFIILGAVFDFFDGMTARLLKVSSPIGKELDSLSDVVTFGVAPSLIAGYTLVVTGYDGIAVIPAIIMALMSSYRLAKFNLDVRQTDSFIGLATPANAFIWLSIPLVDYLAQNNVSLWFLQDGGVFFSKYYRFLSSPYFIVAGACVCSVLLVSEIPMFSLKFHNLKFGDNKLRYVFLAISAVLFVLLYFGAIPIIIIMYIILSIFNNISKHSQR